MEEYEVIVVGAGVMGSATAYYLAKEKSKVLLLEQFDFLHRKGSSHGDSRYTYCQDYYTQLMFDSYKLWDEAEKESKTKVFTQTGGLDFGHRDNPSIQRLIEGARKFGVDHEIYDCPEKFGEKFPMLKLESGNLAVYSPSSGILNATKAVSMFQQLARERGCILKDNCPVANISQEGLKLRVKLENGEELLTKKCILTCGPWAKKMVRSIANLDIPLKPLQTTVAYWKVDNPEQYSSKTFPVYISYEKPFLYGFPCHEFPNLLKCCGMDGQDMDPDKRTFEPAVEINKEVGLWLQKVFEGVSENTQMTESCMFTESPDHDFIIDSVPGFEGLLIGCGFSGHGFKLAPVVGRMLAKWTISGEFPYKKLKEIFSLKRFQEGKVKTIYD